MSNDSPIIISKMHTVSSLSDMTCATEESSSSSESRRVSFGKIHVREYERVVGDHPDTKVGVPLSIGWGYIENKPVSILTFEAEKKPRTTLRMSSITRKNILHEVFGVPEEELRAAEKEIRKIQAARVKSNKQSKVAAQTESAFTSVKRKMKRALSAEKFFKGISAVASGAMMMPMTAQM